MAASSGDSAIGGLHGVGCMAGLLQESSPTAPPLIVNYLTGALATVILVDLVCASLVLRVGRILACLAGCWAAECRFHAWLAAQQGVEAFDPRKVADQARGVSFGTLGHQVLELAAQRAYA